MGWDGLDTDLRHPGMVYGWMFSCFLTIRLGEDGGPDDHGYRHSVHSSVNMYEIVLRW